MQKKKIHKINHPSELYPIYFSILFGKLKREEGDIVECGVGAGHTLSILMDFAQKRRSIPTIWTFDSFQGFPERTFYDHPSSESNEKVRQLKNKYIDTRDIREMAIDKEYPMEKVKIVKGFFQDTIPSRYKGSGIILLHLDCDLYHSYKKALELYEQMLPNGIIAFDEYSNPEDKQRWPGAKKAIDEFLKTEKLKMRYFFYKYREQMRKKFYVQKVL